MRLSEAFKALDALNEDTFSLSDEGIKKLAEFENNDDLVDELSIIDLEAETEDDFEESYVGKVILDCCVCHSKLYKDKEDVEIDEESQLANVGEDCPYCYTPDGFKVIGEVAAFNKVAEESEVDDTTPVDDVDEKPTEEEVNDDKDSEKIEESLDTEKVEEDTENDDNLEEDKQDEPINESVNNVNVETDDDIINVSTDDSGKVSVTTEPKGTEDTITDDAEVVIPVSDETENELLNATSEEEVIDTEETFGDDVDVEIEDFDEESFDDLGEQYFREAYNNVETFRTVNVTETNEGLLVEGVIKFTSGNDKKTSFLFESHTIDKDNKVRFIGENKELNTGKAAFTVTGSLNENKLIVESLNYNYEVKDDEGNTNRLSGIVKRG